jgi:hypothetical protein
LDWKTDMLRPQLVYWVGALGFIARLEEDVADCGEPCKKCRGQKRSNNLSM